jgi:HlyD family secretion protein
MDRPLDPRVTRRLRLRQAGLGGFSLAAGIALFGFGPRLLRPSLARDEIRTAVVEEGAVEATLSATGTVVPEVEHVLSSPIDARVLRVRLKPGARVEPGTTILDLDVAESRLALEKLVEQVKLKRNEEHRKRLALDGTLAALRSRASLAAIDVKSFRIKLEQTTKLRESGLVSDDDLRKAGVDFEKAEVELSEVRSAIANAESANAAELEGLGLETAVLAKERDQAARQLEVATARADRGGVLTWVVEEEGASVRRGDVLARIADLSTFRVLATLSDVHAQRVAPGMPARIRVNEDATLAGTVRNILPTIKDGVMTLVVALDEKSSPLLRANLRVDVFIVTDRRGKALRVRRGPFAMAGGEQDVFVVRGDRAVRRPVRLGLMSFEYVEVQQGLFAGDEVIVSDMRDYAHLSEVRLK